MTLLLAVTGCGEPAGGAVDAAAAKTDGASADSDTSADAADAVPDPSADATTTDAAADDGAVPDSGAPDMQELPTDTSETAQDAAPSDGDAQGPAADADAADAGPDAAIDVAPTPLLLQVTAPKALKGNLYVMRFAPADMLQTGGPPPEAAQVVAKIAVTSWPWQGTLDLPKGTWVLGAILAPGDFDPMNALAMGFGCSGGKSIAVICDVAGVTPATLSLTLLPMDQVASIASVCGGGLLGAAPTSLFSETFSFAPASVQAGGAHLLDAVWSFGTLWVAGHQDGFVSFAIDGVATPQGQAGWQTNPKGLCSRLEAAGDWLACTSRRPVLVMAKTDLGSGKPAQSMAIELDADHLVDGVALRKDRLVLAVHAAGLVARSAVPPFQELPLPVSATLSDAWDVQPLGTDHLAVADGAGGLVLAKVSGTWQVQPAGQLELPGLSTVLGVAGSQVVVGSASGRVSLVDASVPSKPILQWTMATPWPVFGVSTGQGLVLAAGGAALWALDLPPPGAVLTQPTVRDAESSYHYAMDVDAVGYGAVAVEFASVRTLGIDPKAEVAPQLLAPKTIYAKPAAVGDAVDMNLRLWSVGNQPVQIAKISWQEDASQGGAMVPLMGSLKIGPFSSDQVSLQAPKTLKGVSKHLLVVKLDPPAEIVVQVIESSLLQPGDPLPALKYKDAAGKLWNVNDYLKGKPGVVVVGAHSCPVAFHGIAAIAHDLAGAVASDSVRVVTIDPWDEPSNLPELGALKPNSPVLFSPLTTADNHDYSALLQDVLAQPTDNAAPMPLVYVVDAAGKIVDCRQGYEPMTLALALAALGAGP
ncbi:MAG: hypothetical protein HY902_06445 [Deltaproteobacteria bacterium]|nr:hypothetical protein [Deltaproteobacteria bacterium]